MESFEVTCEPVDAGHRRGPMPLARAELSGVIEVPQEFKPSSLIGESVKTLGGSPAMDYEATIKRAYTLRRRAWEIGSSRKRVKFVAS